MRITSRLNPVGGFRDFWNEFSKPTPYRWPILALSFMMSGGMIYVFTKDKAYPPPERPLVSYITTFAEGRSDEEIIATNIENQRIKEEREAERARIEAEVKDAYRALGRATGIDVDAIERDLEAEEAAEKAGEPGATGKQ